MSITFLVGKYQPIVIKITINETQINQNKEKSINRNTEISANLIIVGISINQNTKISINQNPEIKINQNTEISIKTRKNSSNQNMTDIN